jgi:DNA repair exonuclease SbcCD nuclease subunit
MFEFVVTTDWHLGKLERFFPQNHIEKQIAELHKPFTYAIERGIKTVVIPGDISDTPNMSEAAMLALINLIYEYDSQLNIIYIAGNHDFADIKKTSMDLLDSLVTKGAFENLELYLKPTQIVKDKIVCNFLPYPSNEALKNKKPCLNFAHIERAGALMDNGRPSRLRSEHDFKCKKEDFTISGHLHTYQYLKDSRTLFPGATTQVKFDDTPKKGFVHCCAKYNKKGKLVVTHEFVNSKPNFVLKRLLIEKDSDWEIVENDKQGIYEIRLAENIVVPSSIRLACPNIFSIIGYKTEINLEKIHEKASNLSSLEKFTPTTGLKNFLRKEGLKKEERLLAKSIVLREIERLGL